MNKVLVAMSGGPKSFITAWLLKKQGMQIKGLMLDCVQEAHFSDRVRELEKILGISIQLIPTKAAAQAFLAAARDEAYAGGLAFNLKRAFHRNILFPKLLELRDSLQCDQVATGHPIILQEDPLTKSTRIYRAQDKVNDYTYDLIGVRPRDLAKMILPIGSIPASMVEKLRSELIQEELLKGFDFDFSHLLDGIEGPSPDQVFQVFNHQGMLLGQELLKNLKPGGFYTSEQTPGSEYVVTDMRPDLQRVVVKLEKESIVQALELKEASWFSMGDLGFKTLKTGLIWERQTTPIPVKVLQFEGRTLRLTPESPLVGKEAQIFKGEPVLFVEGHEILGGAFVSGVL